MHADLVGRARELALVEKVLVRATSGVGGIVVVSGEAGIGKSRLAAEVAEHAVRLGFVTAWGRCREGPTAPPLWPWLQVLRSLGLSMPASILEGGESSVRLALFENTAAEVEQAAQSHPLLVVVEDLHCADEASLRLLEFLLDRLWPAPIALIVTVRETEAATSRPHARTIAELARVPWARRARLSGLDSADVSTWVALAAPDIGTDLAVVIAERTGGNPLYVAEVLQHVAAGGDVDTVPPTVVAVIAERVERLAEPTREALALGAMLGRDFDYPPLAAALGESPLRVLDRLEPAVRAGLVDADPIRSGAYRFAHALVAEAVAAAVPLGRRVALHASLFTALRDTGCGTANDLAHHAVAGRVVLADEVVVTVVEAAARDANGVGAWEDAQRWWRLAVELGGPSPARHLGLGRSILAAGAVGEARSCFEAAADLARRVGDSELVAEAALAAGDAAAEVAPDRALLRLLDLALAEPGLGPGTRARVAARRGVATYWLPNGQRESRDRTAGALDQARHSAEPRAIGDALVARQFTLRGPDLLAERLQVGRDVWAHAEATGDEDLRFRACQWLVADLFQAGDLHGARNAVATMEAIVARQRNAVRRWWVLIARGLFAIFDAAADAESIIDDAQQLGRRLDLPAADAYHAGQLARLWWRTERLDGLMGELHAVVDRFPGLVTLQCNLALALAATGERRQARGLCRRLCRDELAAIPKDSLFLASAAIVGEAIVACDLPDLAPTIIAALTPYGDRNLIQGVPVGWGAAAWHLARVRHFSGDNDAAIRDANLADDLHQRWGAQGYEPALERPAPVGALTSRERTVLGHLASGASNKEIATTLRVSVHTVERHVANIFIKIGTRNRADATSWAHRNDLVS